MSLPQKQQKANRLQQDFYARDTLLVARDLLGMRLVRLYQGQRVSGRIVETEAYIGVEDQASHAAPGLTRRNAPMFGPAGYAYVYLIYGMYSCFNVVTEQEGFPSAILIRAIEPLEGLEIMLTLRKGHGGYDLTRGPGRLCQALAIDRAFSGKPLFGETHLWLEQDTFIHDHQVAYSPRINVQGDEHARTVQWRFYVPTSPWISGKRKFNEWYFIEANRKRLGIPSRSDGEGEI